MAITINLKRDLRNIIMATMPYDTTNPLIVAELNDMAISNLCIRFTNWCSRLVSVEPRTIYQSSEFQANPLAEKFRPAVNDIMTAIENGLSLTSRLSRQVAMYGYVESSNPKQLDKDLMLNEWGVHHLHLGTKPYLKDPRFIERTNELMFVFFNPKAAYVIDIMPHGSWTNEHIAHTAIKNWPEAQLFLKLHGVLPSPTPISETDRATLRNSHVCSPVQINGEVYAGCGAMSMAGTSLNSVTASGQLLRDISLFEESCLKDPLYIKALFEQNGVEWPIDPIFKFSFFSNGYGVIETETNSQIRFKGS